MDGLSASTFDRKQNLLARRNKRVKNIAVPFDRKTLAAYNCGLSGR
jgi:hypothetical protein